VRLSLAEILDEHRRQFEADPSTADRSLLESAKRTLRTQLRRSPWTSQLVHGGYDLYFRLGDKQAIVDMLSRYLMQPLQVEEEAWARWEVVDNLAMLNRSEGTESCRMVVGKHKEFLAWSRRHLPHDRLLWVMGDGTQAICWIVAGQGEEWLQVFEEVVADITPTEVNRYDRFLYLRTAGGVLSEMGRRNEALRVAQRIRDLCREDTRWERAPAMEVESFALEMKIHRKRQDVAEVRRIGLEATALLEDMERDAPATSQTQRQRMRTLYHNAAAPLYFAQQYDLAVPLFRRAIELGIREEWTFLWLAASLWAMTGDRVQVLALLERAAPLNCGGNLRRWVLPEFADVATDPDFLKAAGKPQQ